MRVIGGQGGGALTPEEADELRRELATAKKDALRQKAIADDWRAAWERIVDRLSDVLHADRKPARADIRKLLTMSAQGTEYDDER